MPPRRVGLALVALVQRLIDGKSQWVEVGRVGTAAEGSNRNSRLTRWTVPTPTPIAAAILRKPGRFFFASAPRTRAPFDAGPETPTAEAFSFTPGPRQAGAYARLI